MLNIKKTLTKLLPTIGSNYIIFCGIGVAWGSDTSSGAWAKQITYGITFATAPIFLLSKAENVSTASNISTVVKTTTIATVNFTTTENTKNLDWIAIGKV